MVIAYLLFIFGVWFLILFANAGIKKRLERKNNISAMIKTVTPPTQTEYQSEGTIRNNILMHNPTFSDESFKRFCEMVYIRYLASIMQKDATNVKGYLHKQLYEAHASYIDTIKMANRNIQIENVIPKSVRFVDYQNVNNIETLKVEIRSQMNNYETDEHGMVINGYRSRVINQVDILTFQRDNNKLHQKKVATCPNCMATLPKIATACDYCGAAVKFDDETSDGWLLSDVRTL